jgi:hypothetical protein
MSVVKTEEGFVNHGSTGKLVRITGSGFVKTGAITEGHPVAFRHWQEVVDEAENALDAAAEAEDEELCDYWLENPLLFNGGDTVEGGLKRGSMVRTADNFGRKQAVIRQTSWDQEFSDAQAHVASVLKNLGNGR